MTSNQQGALSAGSAAPYYSDDLVTLYNGDCREVLPQVQAGIMLTDPPYGAGHYGTDVRVVTGVTLASWVSTFTTVAVFGWPERLVALCAEANVHPNEWITWWPTNGALRGTNLHGLWKESEAIAVFGPHTFAALRQPRTAVSQRIVSANYDVGVNGRGDSHGEIATRRVGDVWIDPAPGLAFQSHLRLHPNEKPLSLMARLVAGVGPGMIVDPFAGSGTTLRAAKDAGRQAIGVEIEERYCEIAARRLAQEVLDFGCDPSRKTADPDEVVA